MSVSSTYTWNQLIPSPNNDKPNFMAWIGALTTPLIDAMTFLQEMPNAFFLPNATGAQLDLIGQRLGLSRQVDFQPTDSGDSSILNDADYYLVLQAKIFQNQWRGTTQEIYNFWRTFFPSYPLSIQDGQNMTMSVTIWGITSQLQKDLVNNLYYIPKPSGVGITFSFATNPVFGYDLENSFIQGYDQGYWT